MSRGLGDVYKRQSHITCREDLYTPSSVELKNELVRAFLTEKAERGDNI